MFDPSSAFISGAKIREVIVEVSGGGGGGPMTINDVLMLVTAVCWRSWRWKVSRLEVERRGQSATSLW